jgi:RNA polymerase sigma factor for flagellar operon FliA
MGDPAAHSTDEVALTERDLWAAWREKGDEQARARLLELHLPYAHTIAASCYARRMHDEIEFDDYLQMASTALVDAANRYDPLHGAQFRTFAARRMYGEILDGIERMTEKQHQIAVRQRILARRREEVRELAREAATKVPEADKVLQFVAEAGLAFALGWLLEGTGLIQAGDEKAQTAPFYASTEIRQLRERMASLVKGLPTQERTVIHGHYFQQQPLESIAQEMNLSKGRISQIHRAALERLRGSLRPLGFLDSG